MDTWSYNVGCGLIATAPVAAGHFILLKQVRYIVLAWLCAFVATLALVFVSLSSLFTTNPWYILLYGVPFEAIGKCLIKFVACRQPFLRFPSNRASIGLACGVGFSLAHVLCLYYPQIFDQPYGVDSSLNHPYYFPNSLDTAVGYHAACMFQIGVSLFLLRFANINIFLAGFIIAVVQYGFGALSQVSIIAVKLPLMIILSYLMVFTSAWSYRYMEFEELGQGGDDKVDLDSD